VIDRSRPSERDMRDMESYVSWLATRAKWRRRREQAESLVKFRRLPEPGVPFPRRKGWLGRRRRQQVELRQNPVLD
jgi:hypothetical protein